MHCTLTNKAVGTIWRALSKPPQRGKGPDLCPLWLLVGTPSAIRPELASLEGGPVNQVNHTSSVTVVTPTNRPKSVRNRCLIELFCGVVCVVALLFWHCCWCKGFCHRTGSDLLFVFFPNCTKTLLFSQLRGTWPHSQRTGKNPDLNSLRNCYVIKSFWIVLVLPWLCTACRLGMFVILLHHISSLFSSQVELINQAGDVNT